MNYTYIIEELIEEILIGGSTERERDGERRERDELRDKEGTERTREAFFERSSD